MLREANKVKDGTAARGRQYKKILRWLPHPPLDLSRRHKEASVPIFHPSTSTFHQQLSPLHQFHHHISFAMAARFVAPKMAQMAARPALRQAAVKPMVAQRAFSGNHQITDTSITN